jgi:hypothetical protein
MTERWSAARAGAWREARPWAVGCNFIPSTAINQLEMWQDATFDAATIDRELGWAAGLGFNSVRVFLHDLLWGAHADAFAARIDEFLTIADGHRISTMLVFFDDCWYDNAALGPQPLPVPGRHNSGWLQSPGQKAIAAGTHLARLEAYVRGVVRRFGNDTRIIAWDMYNEPTNGFMPGQAVPVEEREGAYREALRRREAAMPLHIELVNLAFEWARAEAPEQPLTAGLFMGARDLNACLTENSDVISFHCYADAERLSTLIARLRRHERPIMCTEYMARTLGSDVRSALPVFKAEGVDCYNWGLVNGKSQTHIAWTGEADRWFHDLLHPDGTPYDTSEAAFIRQTLDARDLRPDSAG